MLSFQLIDIRDGDETAADDEDSSSEERTIKRYTIYLFGRTALKDDRFPDKSVCLRLHGYEPYFFLRVPSQAFSSRTLAAWLSETRGVSGVTVSEPFESKDFDGFRAERPSRFVRVSSPSSQLTRRTAKAISNAMRILCRGRFFHAFSHTLNSSSLR